MAYKAAEHLRHDPIKLRFTTTNPSTGQGEVSAQTIPESSISEIIAPSYATRHHNRHPLRKTRR